MHVIWTRDDSLAVAACLEGVRDVVVVGGGFIGAEVAAALAPHGPERDPPRVHALSSRPGRSTATLGWR
ncbi:MAG: NAD-binding protein [Bowdeniella nasicola]|nr:NAD-binding protein [Bowdeniella nasicola]